MKEAAEISMGTEISEEDVINVKHLCQQVVDIQVSFRLIDFFLMQKVITSFTLGLSPDRFGLLWPSRVAFVIVTLLTFRIKNISN